MPRILVIDDEPGICQALERFFRSEGHEVRVSSRAETAPALATAFEPDLVVLDVRLPGMSGLDLLPKLKELNPDLVVVVVTAYGTLETAVEAMQRGAYDYLLKPLDIGRVAEVVERGLASRRQAAEVAVETAEAPGAAIFGKSPAMQEVFKKIGAVSLSEVPVLVSGEPGTGKERVARAIHYASSRSAARFEPVSCSAIPEDRQEEEVLGRAGAPDGGTLFLDDVGSLAPAVQVALLRHLEADQETEVPRVISASSGDLRGAIAAGRFREDLFYRLSVVTIPVPPLRNRLGDLPALAAHFLRGAAGGISREALRALLAHTWPGNVRELRNAVEHALVLSRGSAILAEHLPEAVREGADRRPREDEESIRRIIEVALDGGIPEGEVHTRLMEHFEAPLVAAVLARTGGNQVQAARLLGIHRTTLRGKIQRYGL